MWTNRRIQVARMSFMPAISTRKAKVIYMCFLDIVLQYHLQINSCQGASQTKNAADEGTSSINASGFHGSFEDIDKYALPLPCIPILDIAICKYSATIMLSNR